LQLLTKGAVNVQTEALVVSALAWMWPTCTIRSGLTMRERGYIRVARFSGTSDPRIIVEEMMPNLLKRRRRRTPESWTRYSCGDATRPGCHRRAPGTDVDSGLRSYVTTRLGPLDFKLENATEGWQLFSVTFDPAVVPSDHIRQILQDAGARIIPVPVGQ
jgi:hypothetical protein